MSPLPATDVQYLQDLLIKRSGHVITDSQSYLFETKLTPLAVLEGLETVEKLVRKLRVDTSPAMQERVVETMTINETFFFRDSHPFEALRETIIPRMIEARQKERSLTIWTAACSSGQEPYSIAMIIREHFPELNNWRVKILATDISDEILTKAKGGTYSQFEVNRGLPARLLVKHFERDGSKWTVKPEIRQMLEFKKLNLTKTWPVLDRCDIVFLRNVLIYFDVPTKEAIIKKIRPNMANDGYLFLGGGESLLRLNVPFEREPVNDTVCFRAQ